MISSIRDLLVVGGALLVALWCYKRIYYIDCGGGVRVPPGATCPPLRRESNP